ncbi:ABC transporter ATP-binding protein [Paraburkholderia aromaticivorans]|uniref:Oligopeptide ABC transporter ATP-binding protein n=1 Tax=Paraburkholderia aromaticivorans TaxID=2026199 RepID=A0A248VXP2_9BURK|nr:oligopeptide/dipeptide ABC transporter ATP-binding protein [Paraburkholderia aromaticivorans]ASW03302.1 oligopeptide ABC transporter ATP-binding protein [Paraburkholderia aromaticivorans]
MTRLTPTTPHADAASSAPSPIIEARALTKHFGGARHLFTRTPTVYAVNDVSFAVNAGETFAIVGESGCGKSTLGRLLLRLIEPTDGRVFYQGADITHQQGTPLRRLRREMQIIFQDPFASLNPGMTIGQIVGEPIALHGLARNGVEHRERVAQLLRTVGLQPAYADRYPHEFSGGQRQRIGIARALAGEPKLIVGDEPVSALDVSVQAQVINLLETLQQNLGLTLIMVAHDLAVIRHMSDRVAVMYLGEIVELADVDALFDAPLHPYTQALLRAIPASSPHERRAKPALSGDLPSPTAPPSGCRFHTRCPHAKPHCAQVRPASERLEDGRQVACHFWREIQNAGGGAPLVTSVSPKLAERLAIYRDRQATLEDMKID